MMEKRGTRRLREEKCLPSDLLTRQTKDRKSQFARNALGLKWSKLATNIYKEEVEDVDYIEKECDNLRKKRNDSLSETVAKQIQDFYMEFSVVLANVNKSVRKDNLERRYLTDSLTKLHSKFKESVAKVGYTSFRLHRPSNVMLYANLDAFSLNLG